MLGDGREWLATKQITASGTGQNRQILYAIDLKGDGRRQH